MFTKMVMELLDKLEQGAIPPGMRSSGVVIELLGFVVVWCSKEVGARER